MTKVSFSNLGNICEGEVELKDFTIFTGENNSGKTYVTYAIYSLLDKDFKFDLVELKPIIKKLFDEGTYNLDLNKFLEENYQKMKKEIAKSFSSNLSYIFSANEDEFSKSKIDFSIDYEKNKDELIKSFYRSSLNIGKKDKIAFEIIKEEKSSHIKLILLDNSIPQDLIYDNFKSVICRLVFSKLFFNTFLLPAERTGLNLFYRELSSERTALFHHFGKTEIDKMALIKDLIVSKYPQPIADYIDFLNKAYLLKRTSSDYKDLAQRIQKEIIKGKYKVEEDGIYFLPYKKDSNKDNFNQKISLHLASSTVKTFFSLVFYLEHLAKKNEVLIIDEPELNLHPDNQRKIARILAMIANRGIKVIVSTHSDYFIREINNLIMLEESFLKKDEIMQKYNYCNEMLLNKNNISAYLLIDNKIRDMEIDSKEGIIAETFDNVINCLNEISDDIYYQKEYQD